MTQTERVTLAQSGDQESIDILVNDHIKYIRFMARRFSPKDRDEAEQYGIQGFLEALNDFDTSRGFKLITYSSYRIRKHMRKALSESHEILYDDIAGDNFELDGDKPSIETTVSAPEKRPIEKRLMDAISNLSDIEREILKLHYFEGLTLREIGDILKLSFARIYQLESRALKVLRKELE